jgi:hypothetical protein
MEAAETKDFPFPDNVKKHLITSPSGQVSYNYYFVFKTTAFPLHYGNDARLIYLDSLIIQPLVFYRRSSMRCRKP